MENFDVTNTNSSLYFQAASMAAKAQAKSNGTDKTNKKQSIKKGSFSSAMQKSVEEASLASEGLPVEIAGMEPEEAIIFLKDAADIAADALKENQLPEYFTDYRKKVSQFLKYIVKNNFETKTTQRKGFNRSGRPYNPQTQIYIIDQKLDEMARWMLYEHKRTLNMLAKIEEIQGMLVDLIAT